LSLAWVGASHTRGVPLLCVGALVMSAAVACRATATAPRAASQPPAAPATSVDTDGDGIIDNEDACPQEPGAPSPDPYKRGCPARMALTPEATMAIIIHFPRASRTLPAETLLLVDAAVAVLKTKPAIRQVAVEGHASSDEPDAQGLSEDRAKSVIDRMVAAGIDRTRLVPRGEASSRPLADNGTATGRAQNRRVEFRILE
jgi:OmpA-OmpF porin, OOP family